MRMVFLTVPILAVQVRLCASPKVMPVRAAPVEARVTAALAAKAA
jgi:hypothetical protein